MGSQLGRDAAAAPPPPPALSAASSSEGAGAPQPPPTAWVGSGGVPGADFAAPPLSPSTVGAAEASGAAAAAAPSPAPLVALEHFHDEALKTLKLENFHGLKCELYTGFNSRFSLSQSVLMGSLLAPHRLTHYELGALFLDEPYLSLDVKAVTDGRFSVRVLHNQTPNVTIKMNARGSTDKYLSEGTIRFGYKGSKFNLQGEYGSNALYACNFVRALTPNISIGAELFWLGHQKIRGFGFATRAQTHGMVATCQISSNGIVSLSYHQKAQTLSGMQSYWACDLVYNHGSGDVIARAGYEFVGRMSRVKGSVDSNACVAGLCEKSMVWIHGQTKRRLTLVLSGVLDHINGNHKTGLGFRVQ